MPSAIALQFILTESGVHGFSKTIFSLQTTPPFYVNGGDLACMTGTLEMEPSP